ncbi:MAG: 23S rRNA (guanosine(2251)-2'-O)-methyltransferase RlmB [bacterium]|nr:23S rRNA (guanosine(2251)-2'-O)-methyltransferase RlmB [bacterium]
MSDHVSGRIPVLECLRAGRRAAHRLYMLQDGKGLREIFAAARKRGVPVEECSRRDLDRLIKATQHQGVVLEAGPLPILTMDDWLGTPPAADALVAILDGVEDPHNFGAIIRSAAACGAEAVVFGRDRAAPISATSMKTAAGAMEHIDLVQVTNLARGLKEMKQAGFWLAALEADGSQMIWDADLTGRIGLVIGSEGQGIRRLVGEQCDFRLRIPLTGAITSLNASVSAGVAFAECLRQRVNADAPGSQAPEGR